MHAKAHVFLQSSFQISWTQIFDRFSTKSCFLLIIKLHESLPRRLIIGS